MPNVQYESEMHKGVEYRYRITVQTIKDPNGNPTKVRRRKLIKIDGKKVVWNPRR